MGANPARGKLAWHTVASCSWMSSPSSAHQTLEVLRQPLEDRVVTISRAQGSITFPANFMLVAAMNPCPCGNYGDPVKACVCSESTVSRYQRRISGPLLDRIDIFVDRI